MSYFNDIEYKYFLFVRKNKEEISSKREIEKILHSPLPEVSYYILSVITKSIN